MIQPSTTNWVQPEANDLLEVLDAGVLARANANVDADAKPGDPTDSNRPTRAGAVLAKMVVKVRTAIRNAGHTPLSVTADCIPPEAYDHALNMAAWRVLNSVPNVQMVVITEKGVYAPVADLNKQAEKWLADMARHAVTPPTDPTGRDWLTAVVVPVCGQESSFDWSTFNPPIEGTVRSGATYPPQDLRTDTPQFWPPEVREVLGTP